MALVTRDHFLRLIIYLLIMLSGFVTLSWEVIWQIKSTLALGTSASGTAITLAVVMGGMGIGGFIMGRFLYKNSPTSAIFLYGTLEIIIGLAGLFLNTAFTVLENIDTGNNENILVVMLIHLFGMTAVLGVPTLCIGATLSVFGKIAQAFQLSVAKLYHLNILGAAVGVLFAALLLIPLAGITHAIWILASINIIIACAAIALASMKRKRRLTPFQSTEISSAPVFVKEMGIVFVTGFATFALEIAWFRVFAALFPNTTDVFAIMLASLLVALGLGAKKAVGLKQQKKSLGVILNLSGILILLVTPLIERVDSFFYFQHASSTNTAINLSWLLNPDTFVINSTGIFLYLFQILATFLIISLVIMPPLCFLGVAFPWILDDHSHSHAIGKLYAINTFAAVIGALITAWFLLPMIGFSKTSWLVGILVTGSGILITNNRKRYVLIFFSIAACLIAVHFETGIGKHRIPGYFANIASNPATIIDFSEGPEANVAVIEYHRGGRALLINSASAAGETDGIYKLNTHYLNWMGHLPMLLHSNPKKALVICFGTGQTANAVRKENPQSLDVVDVNSHIFTMAHHFKSNENVLNDKRVKAITMDGRAYLRRKKNVYDVITLEPMPPITNGMNALYSKEFYELVKQKLTAKGIVAQWLPFHVTAPYYAASIAKTFIEIFPNAILWIDPFSKNGILLGSKDNGVELGKNWPGFGRGTMMRTLTQDQVIQNVALDKKELEQYASYGKVITDDNQLLAYGKSLYVYVGLRVQNFQLLHRINNKIVIPSI